MSFRRKLGAGPVSCPNILNEVLDYLNGELPELYANANTFIDELNIPQARELFNFCTAKFDLDVNALDEFDVTFATIGDLCDHITKLNPHTVIL